MRRAFFCSLIMMGSIVLNQLAYAATKVFLLAGQSNMSGLGGYTGYPLGKPWDNPPYDHADVPCPVPYHVPQSAVKFWNYGAPPGADHVNVLKAGDAWVDLRPGFGHRDDGFGPEVSFGYTLHKLFPKDEIYLVKSSTSGTNLAADWNPNPKAIGPQYKLFKSRVDAALKNLAAAGKKPVVAGMVWMQGEDDSTNPAWAKAYRENLRNFVAQVRSDFHAPEMRFVLGRISYMSKLWTSTENIDTVRNAQSKVSEYIKNASWVNTDDLKWAYYGHYGTQGQIELGIRFAKEFAPKPAAGPRPGQNEKKEGISMAIDDANLYLAPYVWKRSGADRSARAEATMPGAYLKAAFQGSTVVRLLIDGAANNGCPAAAMPVVDFSVDHGAFKSVQLTKTGEVYSLPLGNGLDKDKDHLVEIYFRSASLGPKRWKASTVHLRLAGIELDPGGKLLPCPARPKRAIGFGDSITEGVCNEGLCTYYSDLTKNNARATWFPLVCAALNCEYGQLGTGGQGMVKTLEFPPLPQTWDHYDPATSRLTGGLLTPEPDYVFNAMGTNDYQGENFTLLPIADAYTQWLTAVRKACPNAMIFCVVPPLGWHDKEIAEVVAARNKADDRKVFLIDTARLKSGFGVKGATQLAPDGVHPSVHGNAMLGALIAVEVQKILH